MRGGSAPQCGRADFVGGNLQRTDRLELDVEACFTPDRVDPRGKQLQAAYAEIEQRAWPVRLDMRRQHAGGGVRRTGADAAMLDYRAFDAARRQLPGDGA